MVGRWHRPGLRFGTRRSIRLQDLVMGAGAERGFLASDGEGGEPVGDAHPAPSSSSSGPNHTNSIRTRVPTAALALKNPNPRSTPTHPRSTAPPSQGSRWARSCAWRSTRPSASRSCPGTPHWQVCCAGWWRTDPVAVHHSQYRRSTVGCCSTFGGVWPAFLPGASTFNLASVP